MVELALKGVQLSGHGASSSGGSDVAGLDYEDAGGVAAVNGADRGADDPVERSVHAAVREQRPGHFGRPTDRLVETASSPSAAGSVTPIRLPLLAP